MSRHIGSYPRARVETLRKVGLDTAISAAPTPWRRPRTVHDPGKVLPDIALATALGGDCLTNVALLRAEPHVLGRVASDPTISRLVDVLAAAGPKTLTATWKKTFGHHPLVAFVDHGQTGSGEPVATLLRPGNTGSNTASDHIETAQLALAQLPRRLLRRHPTPSSTGSSSRAGGCRIPSV